MTSPLLVSIEDRVATLTINRPESRNDISEVAFVDALEAACRDLMGNDEVCAVVLTGAGKSFSSGGNIKMMHDRDGMFGGDPVTLRQNYRNIIQRIPKVFYDLDIPTIAAVNGAAIGAGCDLTLMCDIRIASEHASFASSFVKLGLVPGDGGAWLLPRALGLSRACEMMFTGDTIDAQTALSWGLISSVVPAAELMEEALKIARRIAANPARTLRLTKRLIREGMTSRLDSLLELSAAYQSLAHHVPEHNAKVAEMLERVGAKPLRG